jgi:carbon storage regulator
MLVLSRRVGEEIVINGNIRVSVVAVKGDRIRLGIDAPKDVHVDRSEVHERRREFQFTEPVAIGHEGSTREGTVLIGELKKEKCEEDTMIHYMAK